MNDFYLQKCGKSLLGLQRDFSIIKFHQKRQAISTLDNKFCVLTVAEKTVNTPST